MMKEKERMEFEDLDRGGSGPVGDAGMVDFGARLDKLDVRRPSSA